MAERLRQPWDPCRETLTEFGPLSSDVKPSGNFLTRLLKKGKSDSSEGSGSSSAAGSQGSSRETSVERGLTLSGPGGGLQPPPGGQNSPRSLTPQPDLPSQASTSRENTPDRDAEDSDGSSQSGVEVAPHSVSRRRMPKRTLSSVLSRLSNILDRSSAQTPQAYKDSDFKQFWMPDSSCKECYDCGDKFTTFRRRHHCRICGQIFCSKCCNQELPGKIIGYKGGIRVCTYCCKVVLRYAQESETTGDLMVTKEDLRVLSPIEESASLHMGSIPDFGLWSPMLHKRMASREDLSPQQSLLSPATEGGQVGGSPVSVPFDLPSQTEFAGSESLDLERKILIQDSAQLREIWRQIQDPSIGVETQTHRVRLKTHHHCIVGRELVDWLLSNDKAAKRDQAVAIGQALLYAGYLESVGTQPPIFKDDICIYKPGEISLLPEGQREPETGLDLLNQNNEPLWFKEIVITPKEDSSFTTSDEGHLTVNEIEARKTFSSDSSPSLHSTRPESGSSSGEVFKFQGLPRDILEEPLPRQDSSSTGMTDDILKGALQVGCSAPAESLSPHGWRVADQLREENGEKLAYTRLTRQHEEHLTGLLQQLLSQAGLSQGWEATINNLMHQASRFVRPDVQTEADDMDIRKHIHIKKIPGGHRKESELYHGVVFTKNIAHKKMHDEIHNPSILLLKGAIEYQRVENKFSSLEPQILQEREFLWNSVSKVAKLQPHILVVERSVSRLAQEFLLQMGITLLFNVKASVVSRIARFTQADIVSSIDGLVSRPRLGMCHRFFCRTYNLSPNGESKTLAYFDGCATHLGCTITLRHGTSSELKKVKDILKFMIYASYNSVLEISFFMDEFAMPRPHPEEDLAIELDPFDPETPDGETASGALTDARPGSDPCQESRPSSDPASLSTRSGCSSTSSLQTEARADLPGIVEARAAMQPPDGADMGSAGSRPGSEPQLQDPGQAGEKPSTGEGVPGTSETSAEDSEQFELSLGEERGRDSPGRVKFNIGDLTQQERRGSEFDIVTVSEAMQIKATEISGSFQGVLSPLARLPSTPSPVPAQASSSSPSPTPPSQQGKGVAAGTTEELDDSGVEKRSRLNKPSLTEEGKRCSTELTELTDRSDPLHTYQRHKDDSIFQSDITLEEQKLKRHRQFQRVLGDLVLSVSPCHIIESPFLESEAGALCELRRYLADDLYWSPLFQPDSGKKSRSRFLDLEPPVKYTARTNVEITEAHPLILCKLTAPVEENGVQSMLSDFRARGGRIRVLPQGNKALPRDPSPRKDPPPKEDTFPSTEKNRVGLIYEKKQMDCLNPANHQRLVVLFSSHCSKSPNHPQPCVSPWVVSMEYYGFNDITLAGFLHRFCFREAYQCPSASCDAAMVDHVRRFVHGKACISVLLRRLEHSIFTGREPCISIWSWCKKCKQVTPVVPLSSDTANLSFAKYLELRFQGNNLQRRGSAQPCGHSLHHDHYQYFGYKTIVASFKYAEIQLREIALPPILVSLNPLLPDLTKLRDAVKQATNKGMDRFSLILENTLKLKNDLQGDAQNKVVSDFVTEQQKEKTTFREFALKLQQDLTDLCQAPPNSVPGPLRLELQDKMVTLRRITGEAVNKWNNKIQEFLLQQQQQKKAKQQQGSKSSKEKEKEQAQEEALEKSTKPSSVEDRPPVPEIILTASVNSSDLILSDSQPDSTSLDKGLGYQGAQSLSDRSFSASFEASIGGLSTVSAVSTSSGVGSNSAGTEDQGDGKTSEKRSRRNFMPSFLTGTNYSSVPLPYEASEHYLITPPCERVPVVVYDHETSSIIAYALSCTDYHQHLREIQCSMGGAKEASGTSSAPISRQGSKANDLAASGSENLTDSSRKSGAGVLSFFWGGARDQSPRLARKPLISAVKYTPSDSEAGEEDVDGVPVTSNRDEVDRNRSGSSKPFSNHIELQFSDGVARFYCRIYYAEQFRKLRKLIFPDGEDVFIRSLSRCKPWEAKGGKSGSTFCKTDDDRFILKQMSWMEVESFEKFAPHYFNYLTSAYHNKKPIALAKILGVYRIGFRNNQTNHALKQDVLVVENLFYNRKITQKFDLKGSMRNRLVNTSGKKEEELVLLDENLLKLSCESPLYIRPHSKTVLRMAITSDTGFLSSKMVMDYSLLVGLDESRQELVVGIIDYIRTFTWDKKLEMVVKSTGRLVGQAKWPTVISPELYRRRFLESMDQYFPYVPDQWYNMGPDTPAMPHLWMSSIDELPKAS